MSTHHPPRPRGQYSASAHSEPAASHHERHCKICSHPDRADIEADFIEWAHPEDIAREYNIGRASIYRHARAVGLFVRRKFNLSFALGRLIERVDHVRATPDCIVRAIHAFARINDEGQWVEPPAHVIVSSGGIRREAAAPSGRRPVAISLDSPALGNVLDAPAQAEILAPATASPSEGQIPGLPAALPETVNRVEIDATH